MERREVMSQHQRGEETHERILHAALEGFAQNGFDATGVAEICRRAGVSKGAFYHHFPSKQAVFLELMEQWLTGLDEQLSGAARGAKTVPERLLRMARMARLIFVMAEEQLPVFLEFWAKASRDPQIWEATISPYRRYRDTFSSMIEEGIGEGTLRPIDPRNAAYAIVGLATGLILQGVLGPDEENWGEVMQEGMSLLLEGLKSRQEPTN
jgi:AcrR family transcriptional regulator